MKMVSQLTRQAMNRHRILASQLAAPTYAPEPTDQLFQPARSVSPPIPPLSFTPQIHPDPPCKTSPSPPAARGYAASLPPQPHTIYQQLMKKHDRMTERHL